MTKKLRQSARGKECQVRIPNVCNHNPETTVLAHLNGAGMAMKQADIHAAYCCSDCHDVVDRRRNSEHSSVLIRLWHYEGVIRTQQIMLKEGLINVG